jgi:hypothetical protein
LADPSPGNAPIRVNDEHGRRGEIVTQKVVDTVCLAYPVSGVGQHGVADSRTLAPAFYCTNICDYCCSQFGSSFPDRSVVFLQLHELRVGLSTANSLEKDQYHRSFGQMIRQPELAAGGLR